MLSIGGRVNGVSLTLRPQASPQPPSLPQPSLSLLPGSDVAAARQRRRRPRRRHRWHAIGVSLSLRPPASPPQPSLPPPSLSQGMWTGCHLVLGHQRHRRRHRYLHHCCFPIFWKTWKEYELRPMMFENRWPIFGLRLEVLLFRFFQVTVADFNGCNWGDMLHHRSQQDWNVAFERDNWHTATVYSTVSWLHAPWLRVNLLVLRFGWRAAVATVQGEYLEYITLYSLLDLHHLQLFEFFPVTSWNIKILLSQKSSGLIKLR